MTGIFLTSALCTEELIVATVLLGKLIVDKYVSKSDGIEPSVPIMTGTVLDDYNCSVLY